MAIGRKVFKKTSFPLLLFFLCLSVARAQTPGAATDNSDSKMHMAFSGKTVHMSCQKSVRDLNTGIAECFGNVYMRRPGELMTSDYARLNLDTEEMHAEGNVVYFTENNVIYGKTMDFNFTNETGVIHDGRIESDKYQLLGEVISRVAPGHFTAVDGEYTTCRDCPASWSFAGRSVDLEMNSYAYLSDVFVRINDAPTVYMPYAMIPVKHRRQTGFLFPRIQMISPNGFTYLQPFFWAISRSQDATISPGIYTRKGYKGEGQYRFMFSPKTYGELDAFYLYDRTFTVPYNNRWALQYEHNVRLPFQIDQKLYWIDTSDRDYPQFIGDIPGRGEPVLESQGSLTRAGRDVSIWVTGKRIRNLLTVSENNWDKNTVQLAPELAIATTDHQFFSNVPLNWGVNFTYDRFWRQGPSFDAIYDYPTPVTAPSTNTFIPGQTPIRRADRYNLVPEIYYSTKFADHFELIPSAQYEMYYYHFDKNVVGPTARGYLLLQNELATTVEHVYNGQVEHKIRPSLTYSNIPVVQENAAHPFLQQINTGGYQFDESDIVPLTQTSTQQYYFTPLGNSLEYKINNRFILKSDKAPYTYTKTIDVTSGESFNFVELQKSKSDQQPWSRFYTLFTVNMLHLSGTGYYYYYPYIKRSSISLGLTYIFAKYRRRVMSFERSLNFRYYSERVISNTNSIGGTLNWSFNDYFGVQFAADYEFPIALGQQFIPGTLNDISGGVTFQSPSQCYKLVLAASWTIDQPQVSVNFTLPLNLTGEGYTDVGSAGSMPTPGTP